MNETLLQELQSLITPAFLAQTSISLNEPEAAIQQGTTHVLRGLVARLQTNASDVTPLLTSLDITASQQFHQTLLGASIKDEAVAIATETGMRPISVEALFPSLTDGLFQTLRARPTLLVPNVATLTPPRPSESVDTALATTPLRRGNDSMAEGLAVGLAFLTIGGVAFFSMRGCRSESVTAPKLPGVTAPTPTAAVAPTEDNASPVPATPLPEPEVEASPSAPLAAALPRASPEPSASPAPVASPEPSASPIPSASPVASASPEPKASPVADATPPPTATPAPTPKTEVPSFTLAGALFDTNQGTLKSGTKGILDEVAATLKAHPKTRVAVRGYTDNVGDTKSNQYLSQRRAINIRQALINRGVEAGRIVAQGFGESDPVASNATQEGRTKNRRVTIKPIK